MKMTTTKKVVVVIIITKISSVRINTNQQRFLLSILEESFPEQSQEQIRSGSFRVLYVRLVRIRRTSSDSEEGNGYVLCATAL